MSRRYATLIVGTPAVCLSHGAASAGALDARTGRPLVRSARVVFPAAKPPILMLPGGERRRVFSMLDTGRMRYGDFAWDEARVPPGHVWVRVDLARQTMSVFRGGHEIGTAVILYGADEKPTPLGRFAVLARFRNHRSSLYDAPMPYTLRLTGDGVAIHGSDVRWGAATHGCIGVPTAFAAHLFPRVRVGDPVMIVSGRARRAG